MLKFILDNFIFITGVVTAGKWVYEYSQNRKFEKNKFLLERIEKFYELKCVEQVHRLLDWNLSKIEINGDMVSITDEILCEALLTHNKKSSFNRTEVYLRSIFDEYFDELNELIILSKCDLIDSKNLRQFLKYWLQILNGSKSVKSKLFFKTIDSYLEFYDFHEVKKFIHSQDRTSWIF